MPLENCEVSTVSINLVENGYLVKKIDVTGKTKTFIARNFEDLGNLFVKWGFTP